jgi:ketosteroid isomerase-like protein
MKKTNGLHAEAALEANKNIARAFVEGLHDLTATKCSALMSDTATWQVMARTKSLPLGDPLSKSEFASMMQTMRGFFPLGVRHEVKSMTAEGDRVAVETESFANMPGGGNYNNVYHFLIVVQDSKITLVREYTDLLYAKEVVFDQPLVSQMAKQAAGTIFHIGPEG